MRTLSKVVLIIVLITLLYSVAKLISPKTNRNQQVITKVLPVNQSIKNNQNQPSIPAQNAQQIPATPDTPNSQGLYQADEILIDGQGKAGQNYIDITSDTPITPKPQNTAGTQNNNNSGGAYAEASVNIGNNTTSAQQYAPGMPAFQVADGN